MTTDAEPTVLGLPPALWESLGLTLRLAAFSTALLLLLCLPVGWWLARKKGLWVSVLESVLSLPIVLPPTVLGFYLLVLGSPDYVLGQWWAKITGDTLTFSFSGLVLGSIIYSFPYAFQPILSAFRGIPFAYQEAASSLGASPGRVFFRILLPSARRGIAAGAILSFAHTLGEFGVVVMLGGSIPGKTRVASIALYDEAQKLNYGNANHLALVLLGIAFVVILTANQLQGRSHRSGD